MLINILNIYHVIYLENTSKIDQGKYKHNILLMLLVDTMQYIYVHKKKNNEGELEL